ncbi:Protein of unknown function [Pedococcus cremeus]|uniref:DUF559 domain-containing protein n=1 Tax=Pedococcus cremeus TaxID=587636 RepID=A0A1H9XGI1_9MICO|nr:DUF559 domain-containing protein [Pedococcus cremeus]SES45224.1 Protein of unknown function [Pedococcus cremeus]
MLAKAALCTPLTRGWWALGVPADDEARHRLTTTALLRHFGSKVFASHQSALVMAGLPLVDVDLTRVHLTRVDDRQSRRQPAFTLHPALGVALTPKERLAVAIVQAGAVNRPISALAAADAALHRKRLTAADLTQACALLARHPGTATARAALVHAEGRHESPGETRLAQVLRHLGITATPQVVLERDGTRYRVDFLLEDAPVVLEFDGKVKYDDRDDLFAEKRREDLLRSWGYEVVRVTWTDLRHPERIARWIEAARRRSRAKSA